MRVRVHLQCVGKEPHERQTIEVPVTEIPGSVDGAASAFVTTDTLVVPRVLRVLVTITEES